MLQLIFFDNFKGVLIIIFNCELLHLPAYETDIFAKVTTDDKHNKATFTFEVRA